QSAGQGKCAPGVLRTGDQPDHLQPRPDHPTHATFGILGTESSVCAGQQRVQMNIDTPRAGPRNALLTYSPLRILAKFVDLTRLMPLSEYWAPSLAFVLV